MNAIFIFLSVVLIVLYAEQDVDLAQQSCSGLENWKIKKKCWKIRFCSQDGMA